MLIDLLNPGRCYPIKTLKHIARFCDRHRLHLISDEVYASCVFDTGDPEAVPFTSILSLDLKGLIDPNLVHVLYGFSKVGH
jgi:aspartate/methionine/tyrosine aminotransferase